MFLLVTVVLSRECMTHFIFFPHLLIDREANFMSLLFIVLNKFSHTSQLTYIPYIPENDATSSHY